VRQLLHHPYRVEHLELPGGVDHILDEVAVALERGAPRWGGHHDEVFVSERQHPVGEHVDLSGHGYLAPEIALRMREDLRRCDGVLRELWLVVRRQPRDAYDNGRDGGDRRCDGRDELGRDAAASRRGPLHASVVPPAQPTHAPSSL